MPDDDGTAGWWAGGDWWQMPRPWVPTSPFGESRSRGVSRLIDPFGFSPAAIIQDIVETVSKRLIGRPVDITFGSTQVQLVMTHMRVDPTPAGPMVGQLGNVELEADDVSWAHHRISHLVIKARNVHISAGSPVSIVAAPILFEAWLDNGTLAEVVSRARPNVRVELPNDGGDVSVMLSDRERWGRVEVEPRVDGSTLELRAKQISFRQGRPRHGLVRRLPPIRIRLHLLPGMELDNVEVVGGRLVLRGAIREWREPVSVVQLDDVVRRIRSLSDRALELPRLAM